MSFYLFSKRFLQSHDLSRRFYMLTWINPCRSNMLSSQKKLKSFCIEVFFSQFFFYCSSFLQTCQINQVTSNKFLNCLQCFKIIFLNPTNNVTQGNHLIAPKTYPVLSILLTPFLKAILALCAVPVSHPTPPSQNNSPQVLLCYIIIEMLIQIVIATIYSWCYHLNLE